MRRVFLLIILVFVAGKYGIDYILSPDFQSYGDRTKAPWTCQVDNGIAGLYEIGSAYQDGLDLYNRVIARCPETSMAEFAAFHKAACIEGLSRPNEAMAAYQDYVDTYPNGVKRPTALRAIDRIRWGH